MFKHSSNNLDIWKKYSENMPLRCSDYKAYLLAGAMAQEAVVTERAPILGAVEARGDMIPKATNTSGRSSPFL